MIASRMERGRTLKQLARPLLRLCLRSDHLWRVVRKAGLPGVETARQKVVIRRLVARFSPPFAVRSGPFRNLIYPTPESAGSVLLPKLLGTYESELHPAVAATRGVAYDTIVDVGCAEGYYAVGLARLHPGVRVLAYDVAERARRLCAAMARANDVRSVELRERCDAADLLALRSGGRHLVVSDCEGFERHLFRDEVVEHLRASDVIVELHDHLAPGVSDALTARFGRTHRVTIVPTMTPAAKAAAIDCPELAGCDAFEREAACAENRGCSMAWLVAAPH